MRHLIGSGGVDGALVGVQNYWRRLLILFFDFLFKDVKAMIIRHGIAVTGKAVCDDLVVESIQEQRPFV